MNRPARTVLVTLVAVGAIAVWAVASARRPLEVPFPEIKQPPHTPATDLKGVTIGTSGCLAAACHGGPAETTLKGELNDGYAWQSAGSVWVAADPHSAAYSLLTEHPHRAVKVTAKEIMRNYDPGKKASEDARCLACHTNPALAEPGPPKDARVLSLREEGVSCEACHGSAGGWVSAHTNWKGKRDDAVYKAAGMTVLDDIGERAMNCLGCHVGAPAENGFPVRDMNHDMIAAGHPRLNFDFAEYLHRLPRHWQEKDRVANVPHPLNPAKAWLVGRTAHAEAACKLLASRAERAKAGDVRTPWPEFAEYNCASCHHNLRAASDTDPDAQWRKDPKFLHGRRVGSPQWQTLWPLTPASGIASPTRADSSLKDVLEQMEVPSATTEVGATAKQVAATLAVERKKLAKPDSNAEVEARKWAHETPLAVPEWDSATQLYFGLAALERGRIAPRAVPAAFKDAASGFRAKEWKSVKEALGKLP